MTGGGFLNRWSRRKRAAEQLAETTPEAGAQADEAPEASAEAPTEAPAEPPAAPLTEEEWRALLPPMEQITAETDIRAFLQKGVPAALRNAALRRAWAADPRIATYEDPARDYFWDWNAPGGVPGGGGALDPERVARMLRDITGPTEAEADDSPTETEATPPVASAAARDPDGAVAPPPTPADAATVQPTGAPAQSLPATTQTTDNTARIAGTAAPVRRRHGGAVPG